MSILRSRPNPSKIHRHNNFHSRRNTFRHKLQIVSDSCTLKILSDRNLYRKNFVLNIEQEIGVFSLFSTNLYNLAI